MPTRAWDPTDHDPTLYLGAAPHYTRGRVGYPPELAPRLAAELGLDGTGRLLDVGCGPGSLTLLLAGSFAEAIGIDADEGMLAEATRLAAERGIDNAVFRQLRAEQLPADLGRFRVVSFAQSFHWLDRPLVAGLARELLDAGGACVHVHATTHRGMDGTEPLRHPRPPYAAMTALVREFLGPLARAGRGVLPEGTADGEDAIYRAAGFTGPTRIELPAREFGRTEDELVDATFSLSGSTPHQFGAAAPEFERRLRALLRAAGPDGVFSEVMREIAIDVWR